MAESTAIPTRTLVFGASGYIGSHLVPRLLAAGHRLRATARHRGVLEGRGWDGVELVAADALQPDTLDAALEGVEVAYYLVHSMGAGADFASRDRAAAEAFRGAAERAGVRRIIYLGGLQPPSNTSEHLESRRETGAVLAGGPVQVIEVRAGIVVGPGSAAFEVIRDLVFHLPLMTTPRWVRSRSQPIALDDLLEYLTRLATVKIAGHRIFDVGGADTLRYSDMLRQFGVVVGRPVRIIALPVLTPRLSSYWLDLVTAVPASVARPLVDGLKHDLLANDAPIRALIPIPLMTYREAVEADLWSEVTAVGGRNGWHYLDILWELRGLIDRVFGGIGMRRGRRDPTSLRVGDALDFWRVVELRPGRLLSLVAEMKLPGSAVLEFDVQPAAGGGSRLVTTARYHPAGILGLLYWYALTPIHTPLFRGLTRALCRRAEARYDAEPMQKA